MLPSFALCHYRGGVNSLISSIGTEGGTDLEETAKIMNLDTNRQKAEAVAARSNMINVVGMLHDRSSQFMGLLMKGLEAGKICVVDVSQMWGTQALILASIILRRIFDRNQKEFTKAAPRIISVIGYWVALKDTFLSQKCGSKSV